MADDKDDKSKDAGDKGSEGSKKVRPKDAATAVATTQNTGKDSVKKESAVDKPLKGLSD